MACTDADVVPLRDHYDDIWFVEEFVAALGNNMEPISLSGDDLRPSDVLAWASAQGIILVYRVGDDDI